MKKVIGTEISPRPSSAPELKAEEEPEPPAQPGPEAEVEADPIPRMPHSRHLLDLRKQAVPPEEPAKLPDDPAVTRDPDPDDASRLGIHQEPEPPEPESQAGEPPSPSEETPSPVGKLRRLFGRRKNTPRQIVIGAGKIALTLIGAVYFLLLTIPLPERLIGIYFVASVVYDIDSQRTFVVALIFLVMVAVSSAIGQSVSAESYAVYAFYFLVIGLIAAIRGQVTSRPKTVGGNSQISS